ncbi:hypothetical protein C8Q77DRAFT_1062410 [Trametes polyzona]|nr:hypothetical protein C8Q77DRAFT_1062410 [Trametes polyzona]
MADISVANAEFIGLWLQLVVVGAYLVYLPQCVLILKRRFWEGLSRYLAAACAVILMIVSTNTVFAMIRAYQAFAPHGHGPPDPERYYENTSTPLCLIKNSLEIVMSIVSDLIIVYRTFIVWDVNSLAFAFPICLLGLNIGLGTWSLRTMSQVKPGGPVSMLDVTEQCCYFMITTFSMNLFCGVMICWRIWSTNRDASQKKRFSALHGLARRVFETATAVHCVILFAIFLTGSLNTNVFFIFIDVVCTRSSIGCMNIY